MIPSVLGPNIIGIGEESDLQLDRLDGYSLEIC